MSSGFAVCGDHWTGVQEMPLSCSPVTVLSSVDNGPQGADFSILPSFGFSAAVMVGLAGAGVGFIVFTGGAGVGQLGGSFVGFWLWLFIGFDEFLHAGSLGHFL